MYGYLKSYKEIKMNCITDKNVKLLVKIQDKISVYLDRANIS